MNALSAIRIIDQALAAMTGQRAPGKAETAPAGTEAPTGAVRVGFERWLASQSGEEAPAHNPSPARGQDSLGEDMAPETEHEKGKPAGKSRELIPAEHPLLAPYMPAPDAPRPVATTPTAPAGTAVAAAGSEPSGRQTPPTLAALPGTNALAVEPERSQPTPPTTAPLATKRVAADALLPVQSSAAPAAPVPQALETKPRSEPDAVVDAAPLPSPLPRPTTDAAASASTSTATANSASQANPAPANARPEFMPVNAAARITMPGEALVEPAEYHERAAMTAEAAQAPSAQPIDRLKARIAAYLGKETASLTGASDARAAEIARPQQPAVDGLRRTAAGGPMPAEAGRTARPDGAAAPQPPIARGASPEPAPSLGNRLLVSAPKPVAAPALSPVSMPVGVPLAGDVEIASNDAAKAAPPPTATAIVRDPTPVPAPVAAATLEPSGKAKRKDSNIGDPSAFGLDAFAKAASGAPDPAQLFGTHHAKPSASPSALTAQTAGQAGPIDRAIVDFSQGLAWIDRLASEISTMASKDGKLSFDINPENLGQLTVSMKKGETGINLALHVTNHDAANILAASHTQLKQELNNAGLQLGSFDIGNQPASGGDGNGGSAARAGTDARTADQAGEVATDGAAEILGGQPDPGVRFA